MEVERSNGVFWEGEEEKRREIRKKKEEKLRSTRVGPTRHVSNLGDDSCLGLTAVCEIYGMDQKYNKNKSLVTKNTIFKE